MVHHERLCRRTELDFDKPVTDNITAYAKWTEITHDVTYDYGTLGTNLVVTARHNSLLEKPANTVVGYSYVGDGWFVTDEDSQDKAWNFASDKVVEDNLTLTGKWVPNQDTEYKVIHLTQAAEGDPNYYDTKETETKTGVTGGTTDAKVKEYEGFTSPDQASIVQKAIAADGSTEVRIYYKRIASDVTFDLNLDGVSDSDIDGLEAPETITGLRFGAHIPEPEALPDVPKWTLSGWYVSNPAETWDFAANTMPAENLTLKAKWEEATYTVNFVTFTDAIIDPIEGKKYGETIVDDKPVDPTSASKFVGWYTDTTFSDDAAWDFENDQVTSNMTLYAKWTPDLLFNMGGKLDDVAIPCVKGDRVDAIDLNGRQGYPVTGYDFAGWYKDSAFTEGQDFPVEVNDDTTLYAKWSPHTYTLKFDANGGKKAMPSMFMTYDKPRNLLANNFQKQGYDFAGWATIPDGPVVYADCQEVTNLTDEKDGLVTLHAVWYPSANTQYRAHHLYQNVTQDGYDLPSDGVELLTGTTLQPADVVPRTTPGYTLASIESKLIQPDGSTIVELKYDRARYNVVFDDGGHGVENTPTMQNVLFGAKIADPGVMTEPGYDFVGWCVDPAEGTTWNFETNTMPGDNLTLKAKWEPKRYTITFDLAGHGYNDLLDKAYLDSVAQPADPAHSGYQFLGWFSDGEKTEPQQFPMPVTGDATIYAKWQANQYDIVFDLNGGTGDVPNRIETAYGAAKVELPGDGSDEAGENADFARAGYDFAGWNSKADGSGWMYAPGTLVNNLTTSNNVDVTLYAKWAPRTDTPYMVHHMLQNLDGTYEEDVERAQQLKGTTAANTGAVATYYEGFTAQDVQQQPIAGDGSTNVYVYYDRTPYTVTYNLNGKGDALTQTVVYGAQIPEEAATAPGYVLLGWYKEKACLNAWDFENDTMPAHDITLYADWRVGTYTITLNMGGLLEDTVSTLQGGTKYKKPANPTVTGYKFLGWFEDALFNVAQTWPFTVAEDKDIFAKWEAKTYELRFSKNHEKTATGSMNYVTVKYGDDFVMPDCGWTIPGYEFQSWNTSAEGTGDTYKAGQTYNSITTGTYVRFYAQWAPSSDTPYKVEHYLQRANGVGYDRADADDEWLRGTTGALAEATFNEYDGYEPRDASVPEVQIKANGTSVVKLYYVRKAYDVTFDVNGMTTTTGPSPDKREGIIFGNKVAKPTAPTAQGYAFDGWYADAACTTEWNFAADTVSDDTTLYAKWVPQQVGYKVEHWKQKLDDGGKPADYELASTEEKSGSAGELTDAQPLTDEGFTARDYDLAAIAGDGGTVVKIYYDRKAHSVAFNANGHGTAPEGYDKVYYGAKVAAPATQPEEPGYTLEGWCTDAACTQDWSFDSSAMPDADLTLYAKWSQNQYTITYDMGGKLSDVEDPGHVYGELVTQPVAPTGATGYTFDRWYTGADHSTVQHYPIQVTGNKTVYAGWKPNTYSIEFDSNGGLGYTPGMTATYDEDATLPESLFIREGMAFNGWGTAPSGGTVYGSAADAGAATVKNLAADQGAVVKLYAQWKGNEYDIVLDPNGTADAPATVHAVYGQPKTLPHNTYLNTGYVFTGWNTEPDGSGTPYGDHETVQDLSALNGAVITLYAQWTPDPNTHYTVDHYWQNTTGTDYELHESKDATGTSGTQTNVVAEDYTGFTAQPITQETIAGDGTTHVGVYYDRDAHVVMFKNDMEGGFTPEGYLALYGATLETPYQREVGGYEFKGWYSDEEKTQKWIFGPSGTTMPDEDITLYTKWADARYTLSFDAGDHSDGTYSSKTGLKYKATVTSADLPEPKAQPGYAFDGWYADAEFLDQQQFPFQIEGNTTLYAKWRGARYDVEFNGNEATVKEKYKTQLEALQGMYEAKVTGEMNDVTMEYGIAAELPENNYQLSGFEFKGWSTDPNGLENNATLYQSGQEVLNLAEADGVKVTLYAQWEAPTTAQYTVKHIRQKGNDETNNPDDIENYDVVEVSIEEGEPFTQTTAVAKTDAKKQGADYRKMDMADDFNLAESRNVFNAPTDAEAAAANMPIAPDGSTVVLMRYNRNTRSIQIEHREGGTSSKYDPPVEVRWGGHLEADQIPANAGIDTGDKYVSDGTWHFTRDGNTIDVSDLTSYIWGFRNSTATTSVTTNWSLPNYTVTVICGSEKDGTTGIATYIADRNWAITTTRLNSVRLDNYGDPKNEKRVDPPSGYSTSSRTYWLDADWTKEYTVDDTSSADAIKLKDDMTFYIKWTPLSYNVHFNALKPNASSSSTSTTIDALSQSVSYEGEITIPEYDDAGGTWTGWEFKCWCTTKDGTGTKYYPGQKVPMTEFNKACQVDKGSDEFASGTRVCYSLWEASENTSYKVSHMQQPTSGTSKSSYVEAYSEKQYGTTGAMTEAKPTEFEGFHLSDTYNYEQAPIADNGSTTIKIYYDRNTYDVTFDVGTEAGATAPDSKTGVRYDTTISAPKVPTSDNYLFDGWYKDKECTRAWDFNTDTVKGETTLYAKWTPCYTVTYDMQGHGSQVATQEKVRTDTTISEPTAPTANGWAFGGWYKEAGCTHPWHFDTDTVTEDTKLYAKWSAQYKVTFDKNGVTADVAMPDSQTGLLYGSKVTKPADLSAAGYVYYGWYKEPACQNEWDFANDTITGSTTLYLKMPAKSYNITYDLKSGLWGDNTSHPEKALYNQTLMISEPTRVGYEFTGWTITDMDAATHTLGSASSTTTATTATGVKGTVFKNLRYNDAKAVKMTANWKAISYTVRYNANINGYSGSMDDQGATYGYSYYLRTNQFVRSNYQFLGWSRSKNATEPEFTNGQSFSNLTTTNGAVVNLYGVWKAISWDVVYDLDGGTFGTASSYYRPSPMYMGTWYTVATPTRTGYDFQGWTITGMTNSEHYVGTNGTTYATSCSGVNGSTFWNLRNSAGTVKFKAVWTPHRYSITLNANGGKFYDNWNSSGKAQERGTTYNGDSYYTGVTGLAQYAWRNSNAFVYGGEYRIGSSWYVCGFSWSSYMYRHWVERAGYTFVGWATSPYATTGSTTVKNLTTTNNATVTLYAIWKKDA